ncbi:FimD/PapC N-terminal domain-containing protein [Providencia vermicola]
MKSMKLNVITKIMLLMLIPTIVWSEEAIDFNTDFLDGEGTENIDFSKFSHANYVPPGDYSLDLEVNNTKIIAEQPVIFLILITIRKSLWLVLRQKYIHC